MVYKFGSPPSMAALIGAAMAQNKFSFWMQYVAEMAWSVASVAMRSKEIPRYPDILAEAKKPRDNRSAEEIKHDLIAKLREVSS